MSEHIETYCGFEILPVETHGVMQVYQRMHYRSLRAPKYIVFHQNGRALEEFRRRPKAIKWAQANQRG